MIKINTKLNIEIGPVSSHAMQYDEAVLYCFSLNIDGKIGWRMPTESEYYDEEYRKCIPDCGWFKGRKSVLKLQVTPVRDLKDD